MTWQQPLILNLEKTQEIILVDVPVEPSEEELSKPSNKDKCHFLPSDCVKLSEDNKVAEHCFGNERQCVVTADWVHVSHPSPTNQWTFVVRDAQFSFGDVYIGLTEASSFAVRGRTLGFDHHGNFRCGFLPNATDVSIDGDGSICCDLNCQVTVTADLKEQQMELEFHSGCFYKKVTSRLDGWTHARAWVSFRAEGDTVQLL